MARGILVMCHEPKKKCRKVDDGSVEIVTSYFGWEMQNLVASY
jgi:hypothetical protein